MDAQNETGLILIADDDVNIQAFLTYIVEGDGHQVIVAKNGLEALQAFEQSSPDVVLLDAMMPRMDGFEVCQKIQQLPGGPQTPILMITALQDSKAIDHAFRSGAAEFISKPIHPATLRHRLRYLLRMRRADAELREREARLQSFLDGAHDLIQSLAPDGTIRYVNPMWLKTLSYTPEDIDNGLNIFDVIHPDYQDHCRGLLEILFGSGVNSSVPTEMVFMAKDGRQVIVSGVITAALKDGQPESTQSILRDITGQKEAEAQLQTSLRELSDLKWALDEHAMIVVSDPQGNILSVNDHFCDLMGYSHAEIVGNTYEMFDSGFHPPEFMKLMWDTVLSGKVWHGEVLDRTKDGSLRWLDTTSVPFLDATGTPHRVIAIRTDITALKEAKARIDEYANELEDRHQELDAYNRTIAHDLKSPLQAIINYAYLLRRVADPVLPEKGQHYLGRIQEQATHMTRMVEQLLVLAQVRDVEASIASLDINFIVNAALQRLEHDLDGVQVTLESPLPPALGMMQWIEEVFANLIENAVKYIGSDNASPAIIIRGMVEGKQVRYEVEDNGIGIAPDHQEHLFELFSRVTPEQAPGSGLGLSIVQRIVTKLGGTVGVVSTVGDGSTFWFTLPHASAAPP